MKISFSPPFIDDDVINEVVDTLKSGWITTGPKVKELEEKIAAYNKVEAVLGVNSWTSGVIMILKWFGLKKGDEVIIPAYTYSATALAVLHAGGTPVMVDIKNDFNIDPQKIKEAITERTKVIIPVDYSGYPCDYNEIFQVVKSTQDKFNPENEIQTTLGRILILNDAAHSLGATYNKQPIGKSADVVVFSLHAVKNITTAEGGAICLNLPKPFNNLELYKELRITTLNCQTKDAFSKSQVGQWKYDIIGMGMKINLPDVNAAIGLAQIRKYEYLLGVRKSVSEYYSSAFMKFNWAILPPTLSELKETSYHLYPLRFKDITEDQRDKIIKFISSKEIAVNVHFIPLPMLSFFKELGYEIQKFPIAYNNYAQVITLPIYPGLSNEELDFITETVTEAYNTTMGL